MIGLGLFLAALAPQTLALWLALVGFQTLRAIREERVLCATFPAYHAYRSRTRRLIPFIW